MSKNSTTSFKIKVFIQETFVICCNVIKFEQFLSLNEDESANDKKSSSIFLNVIDNFFLIACHSEKC